MLASILPGLRELRTPLTVGYAWMLVGYLAFGYRLPKPPAAQGPLADLHAVVEVVTPAGLLVVASVAAYLIGLMVSPMTSALTDLVLRRWGWVEQRWAVRRRFLASDRVQEALGRIITDRLADRIRDEDGFRAALVRHAVETGQLAGADIDPERLDAALRGSARMRTDAVTETMDIRGQVEDLEGRLALIAERMRGADDGAGAEYDRLRSAAEFRAGMAWPLLGLFATLSVRASPWFAFGLLGVVLVLRGAAAARQEAKLQLASVLAARQEAEAQLTSVLAARQEVQERLASRQDAEVRLAARHEVQAQLAARQEAQEQLAARRGEERALRILDGVPARQLLKRIGVKSLGWAIPAAARQATALAVSPDGALIAGGMNDGRIHLWDALSGSLLLSLDGHRDEVRNLVFTPDGKRLISAAEETTALVWEVGDGSLLCRLEHEHPVTQVAFDPANGWVVTATVWQVCWFSVPDGERRHRAPIDAHFNAVAVRPDGTVAIGNDEAIVSVVAGGGEPKLIGGPHEDLNWLHWIGPARLLSVSGRTMMIWEQGPTGVIPLTRPPVRLAVAAGTELVALAFDNDEIAVAASPRWAELRTVGDHRSTIKALACSADGRFVVSASEDGALAVWDVATGRRLRRLSVKDVSPRQAEPGRAQPRQPEPGRAEPRRAQPRQP